MGVRISSENARNLIRFLEEQEEVKTLPFPVQEAAEEIDHQIRDEDSKGNPAYRHLFLSRTVGVSE